jgi:ABC-type sugar transport system ATPase subunit
MLVIRSLSKSFYGNAVLEDVDFDVNAGEVHALIGENGAGKSTLVNIIAGIHKRDSGSIQFDEREVSFEHPLEAMAAGISVVHQELSLVPTASVAENIFLRREKKTVLGFNDWKGMNRAAQDVFGRMGFDIDPSALVGTLSVGFQQIVEIAKALALDARLIIMDEPTSSLSDNEIDDLFKLVRRLKSQGLGVVFISHKLSEIFSLADRITVLRDGRHVGTRLTSQLSPEEVIRQMVGRHLGDLYPRRATCIGDMLFRCRNLSRFGAVAPISFEIHRGEIVGLAGLVGAGRTEAMRALVNADRRSSGSFELDGQPITIANPQDAIRHGIVYVSEDRKSSGLFLSYPVAANIVAATLGRFSNAGGFINSQGVRTHARRVIADMDIRPPDEGARVLDLSGGNQQKVMLAKALDCTPRLLIVDEPTRGVDVGAKSLIHARLRQQAQQGAGVIVVSSEMPEVLGMSDRVLVFRDGGICAEFDNRTGELTQEAVMTAAAHR